MGGAVVGRKERSDRLGFSEDRWWGGEPENSRRWNRGERDGVRLALADQANIWVVAEGERKHLWWVGLLALGGCGKFGGFAGSWLLGWSVVVAGCLRLGAKCDKETNASEG
ncbi:hypothetical protein L3X38_008987 [Prunus dulcis]|uniref:Uncharacterized protein n=1 Tax=Prunus dulcis TaxID=3755 RepID=A0AAD4ZXF2_PRUDU|nr:hypothetical protein L3X38_008987 [Prunus dulcis]